jgi:hypothetical protein
MKRVMWALVSMALAGASFALKASAAPATTTTIINDMPFNNTTLLNPCNGELVTFSGVLHATYHETARPDGSVDVVQNLNSSDVKSIDVSGNSYNSYVGHETSNDGLHVAFHGALVMTVPISFGMVTKGSAPNFRLHSLMHITFNANFSVTSFVDNPSITCGP